MKSPPVIVKYGGSLLDDPDHRDDFLKTVAVWSQETSIVLVHGGGKEISRQMERAGLAPRFVNGRRYTDEPTMTVVEEALHELNSDIVARLQALGRPAKGYSGRDSHVVEAAVLAELGRVGVPKKVDAAVFGAILARPELAVFYSVAEDEAHQPLNVNADDFALALAVACHASRLIYLTDTGGLLNAEGELIPTLDETELERLINQGVISGGMMVKVRACVDALKQGIGSVGLVKDVAQTTGSGTTITLKKNTATR